ncbi:SRPBCC family protein [Sinorhizobium psoraleae]|uniref:SRPBCC family protein n=1 Tax=Sinorhizobium psoraleae TaxID=520838 RepID=UPI001AEDD478
MLEVEPERLLRYLFAADVLDTTITWWLTPEGNGTHLSLQQRGSASTHRWGARPSTE